jgi:uncharacterized membrane protein YsdA (DUF1294 family)
MVSCPHKRRICQRAGDRQVSTARLTAPEFPHSHSDARKPPHNLHSHLRTRTTTAMPPRARPRHRPYTLASFLGTASLILPTCTLIRLASIPGYFPLYSSLYIGALSSITFLFYGYDKMQARNELWRVRESTLHTLALVGGWPGALAGMHYFQHKTRKTGFQVVFWGIVAMWEGVWWAVWSGGIAVR